MTLSKKTNAKYFLILIFIILVIVSFNGFMGEDEGRFSYMGRIWANNGLPPYAQSLENKTPGIFILNAISFALFGTNIFFVRLLGIISLTISSYFIYKITYYIFNREAGITSMLIFGLTMSWRDMDGAFASYTESFMILFALLAFFIFIKPNFIKNSYIKIFIAGIMMGIAIAFKQIALTTAFALLLFILFYKVNNKQLSIYFKESISYSAGIMIGTLISILPLFISGVSFIEYFDGAWLLLLDDGSTPTLARRFLFARELWLESRLVFFYPFFIILIFQPLLLKNRYFILLIIWLVLDFIGVNASGYYFGHQIKQLVPALSIIIGILLINLIDSFSVKANIKVKYFNRMIIVLVILFMPYELLSENYLRLHKDHYTDINKEVGLYIKENTEPTDYVFMMTNANAILSYSDRVSSSKFFNPLFMNNTEEYQFVFSELNAKVPEFIVLRSNEKQFTFPDSFHQFVNDNYSLSYEKNGFLLYQLNK